MVGIDADYVAAGLQIDVENDGKMRHGKTFVLKVRNIEEVDGENIDDFENTLRGLKKYAMVLHSFRSYEKEDFICKEVYAKDDRDAENQTSYWLINEEYDSGCWVEIETNETITKKPERIHQTSKSYVPCWWCKLKSFIFG